MKDPKNGFGKSRGPRGRRSHLNWLALGTITAYSAMAFARPTDQVTTLQANDSQQTTNSTNDHALKQGTAVRRFNISQGPLDTAIAAFEEQTGLAVMLSIPSKSVSGFVSPGVQGLYSDTEALTHLLSGTGLSSSVDSSGNISIALRADESVVVNGENAPQQVSLDRYPVALLDTPQAISVISKATMHEQGVTTLRDTLRNAPGISLAAGEGGSQGDNLTLRGFTARNDIFLDGMRDFGSYYRDPFNYEEVDVLEGPSSVSFGRGSTGGVINQESKSPALHPFITGETDLGTDLTRRGSVDINQPLHHLGPGAAARLNIVSHASNVSERDVAYNQRFGIAPEIALGLGTPTRLKASYFHFNENDIPDYGIPWYFNKPADVARNNYYGFRSGNFLDTNVNMADLKLERDIDGWATIRNKTRYANNERNARITEPQLNNNSAGAITLTTPLDEINVNRNQIAVYSNESFLWDQLDSTIHASTFGIKHAAVLGAEGGRETSDPRRPTFNTAVTTVNGKPALVNSVPTTNLLRPNEDQAFNGNSLLSSNVHLTSLSWGVYLLDTMQFGRRWEFTGGARFDSFSTNEKSLAYTPTISATGTASQGSPTITYPSRLDRKPSWRGAFSYKPTANGSIYFDYGTSWNPSAEALSLTVGPAGSGTANLAPEFNRSYEAGTKWDFHQSRFSARADVFRTTKDNAREASPTNSLVYVLAGTQRVDGAEIAITGRINSKWQVLSNYTYMHSEVVNSQYYPLAVGHKLANVPDNIFNLWTTYQPLGRWSVGVGGNFVDSRTASSTVPLDPTTGLAKQVPSYFVMNAMSSYSVSEHVSLQANVFNLANRNYIDEIHPGHVVPGAGTSGLFGLNFKF